MFTSNLIISYFTNYVPLISLNISILSAEPARANILWHIGLLSSIVSLVEFTTASTCKTEISPALKYNIVYNPS